MRVEWDEIKNRRNQAKHGIRFQTAIRALEDPFALSLQDRIVNDEQRWQTLGTIDGVVILVAHTYREQDGQEVVRVISARKDTPGAESL